MYPNFLYRPVVALLVGAALGGVLIALAGVSFWVAAGWAGHARGGAVVGYATVGVFLLAAGISAVAGGWNHTFRVLKKPPSR
ncbi:MAG: hypothetical protein ACREKN_03950 [Longimicrobiaceae bacterium]